MRNIFDDNIYYAIGLVEGDWCSDPEARINKQREECTATRERVALNISQAENEDDIEWAKRALDQPMSEAMYGAGGWHRYFVLGNGEVVFSAHHAKHGDGVEKAEAANFRIWR